MVLYEVYTCNFVKVRRSCLINTPEFDVSTASTSRCVRSQIAQRAKVVAAHGKTLSIKTSGQGAAYWLQPGCRGRGAEANLS